MTTSGAASQWLASFHLPLGHILNPVRITEIGPLKGKIVSDCDRISTTKGQLSTHICKDHLSVAIGCYICRRKWWSTTTWMEHMCKTHSNVDANAYFVKEGTEVPEFEVKEEVTIIDV